MEPRFKAGDFVLVNSVDAYDRYQEYIILIVEAFKGNRDRFHTYRFYDNNTQKIYTRILEDTHNFKFKRIE